MKIQKTDLYPGSKMIFFTTFGKIEVNSSSFAQVEYSSSSIEDFHFSIKKYHPDE